MPLYFSEHDTDMAAKVNMHVNWKFTFRPRRSIKSVETYDPKNWIAPTMIDEMPGDSVEPELAKIMPA